MLVARRGRLASSFESRRLGGLGLNWVKRAARGEACHNRDHAGMIVLLCAALSAAMLDGSGLRRIEGRELGIAGGAVAASLVATEGVAFHSGMR